MLEEQEALVTWKVYHDPLTFAKAGVELLRLEDHRLAYLEYEGAVSGGRGQVRRVCRGTYEVWDRSEHRWGLSLNSTQLTGRFTLRHLEASRWLLEPSDP